MVSNLYDSELVSGVSSSDIKLDTTSFYTPTSAPLNQTSSLQQQSQQQQLRQQLQQQIQQEQQQFYSHSPSGSYGNLNDSFMSSIEIPSPPPLEPDTSTSSIMNLHYLDDYSQLPLVPHYADYYGAPSNIYAPHQVPRGLDDQRYNLMLRYDLSSHSRPGSEYHPSPVPSPHPSQHGHLVDHDWYNGRRQSLSRSHSPHSLARHQGASVKDEEDLEDLKVELPYAKLIHKALMEAPNHAMSLQDIYKWFMENTEKGSSSTSGWRNSIRHNLSMNQVRHPPLSLSLRLNHNPANTKLGIQEVG